jgi:Ca-activated chloride channel family protein
MIGGSFLWATPWAFLLLPVPLLAHALLKTRHRQTLRLTVPDSLVAESSSREHNRSRARRSLAVSLLAWATWFSLVVALAGPQTLQPAKGLPLSGRDIIIAIDFSGSMERTDFYIDGKEARRLDAVKQVGAELLRLRQGDRVGLVVFADAPFVAAMPTFDLDAVESALLSTEIGMVGRSTAIGEGLGLSIKILDKSPAKSRLVILLSDGTNTAGAVSAESAAGMAAQLGVKVHTISLGTDQDERASSDRPGVKSAAALLKEVAMAGGGEAFQVKSFEDLQAVADALNRLEPNPIGSASITIPKDLWPYPAGLVLLLCVCGFILERRIS